jgi:hypothetical protein
MANLSQQYLVRNHLLGVSAKKRGNRMCMDIEPTNIGRLLDKQVLA